MKGFKRGSLILIILLFGQTLIYSQDTIPSNKKTKSGFSFGAVPAIAFDSDIGFKYGAVVNLYDYGDGSIYPDYKHSLYLEWSRTTKGSGINQVKYDSKYLIPNIRVAAEISYLTEQALDFYGFNGYESAYLTNYEDDDQPYGSRMFYKTDRKLLRIRADFEGKTKVDNLNWLVGFHNYNIALDTLDINTINKGNDNPVRPVDGGLYGLYKQWEVIPDDEYSGGSSTLLKAGMVYDTRDNEANPVSGIWSQAYMLIDPGLFGEHNTYGKYVIKHHQYFRLVPGRLSLACRAVYQGTLFGSTPSYMQPLVFNGGRYNDRDGLGGSKTLRGILRNRVVGEDMAYGNFEFRWKFVKTNIFNQDLYLALSTFTDMGIVTRRHEIDLSDVSASERELFFPNEQEKLHQSVGTGLRIALNENFIVAVDYGIALNKKDGDTGLYINMDWLF